MNTIFRGISPGLNLKNAVLVSPSDDLQVKYNWLKSSSRDGVMGALSATNRRTLILTPGVYTGNLTADTDFVDCLQLTSGSCTFSGTIAITADDAIVDTYSNRALFGGACNLPPQEKYVVAQTELCDAAGDWTPVYCTASADTTYFISSAAATQQSVKMTAAGDGVHTTMNITKDRAGINCQVASADPFIRIRFYIHEGSGASSYTQINNIRLQFSWSTGWTNWSYVELCPTEPYRPGWYTCVINPKMWEEHLTGSIDWTALHNIRFKFDTDVNTNTPAITLDQIQFIARPSKAKIAVTFDDGLDDDYLYAAYMASKGMCGTFYVITSVIGSANRLTLSQARQMQQAGHLVANHSHTHKFLVTGGITVAALVEDARKASEWLVNNGFAEGARIYSQPGGSANWNESLYYELLGKYVDQIRTTFFLGMEPGPPIENARLVWTADFDDPTTFSTLVTNAATDSCVYVFGFHSSSTPLADFKTFIDNLATARDAGTVEVVTMAELLRDGVW